MTNEETTKQAPSAEEVVDALFAAFEMGDIDAAVALYSEDVRVFSETGILTYDSIRASAEAFLELFPPGSEMEAQKVSDNEVCFVTLNWASKDYILRRAPLTYVVRDGKIVLESYQTDVCLRGA